MKTNDYELVYLAQTGNEDAINLIYKKYKPIIVKKSKNAIVLVTHHGVDINDIMQEGYIGLDEAIKNFSQDTDASFYTFSMLCIERQIMNYLKKITGGKNQVLNDAIEIDENLEKDVHDNYNIENNFMGRENNIKIAKEVRNQLTDYEKKVFDLKLKDYSFEEIASILNKDVKSIYNTFQRIKTKFKKIIKIDN